MAPISAEFHFSNPNNNFTLLAENNQKLEYILGDQKIELIGFKRGGETRISLDDSSKTISLRKNHSKDVIVTFTKKHNVEERVDLHLLGK